MKKLKMLFTVVAMLMLFSVGALFGCGDKYANMKITTDLIEDTVVLYFDQEEGEEEQDAKTATFVLSVEGAGGVSTDIKWPYITQNIVKATLSKQNNSNKTQVTLTAINCGEADMIFTTEEGGKTKTIHVVVGYRLKSLKYNSEYKPYALVGETTKINTTKCLTFLPGETTQKDVTYQMVGTYQGVELLPDGTIITADDALNGSFRVKATSEANSAVSVEFDVNVIAGIEELAVKYGEKELEIAGSNLAFEKDALYLSSNMYEELYKILELVARPEQSSFKYSFAFTNLQGQKVSKTENGVVASDVFECNIIDENHIGITALSSGDELLEIRAYIDNFEYISKPFYIKLHSERVAKNVTITDVDSSKAIDQITIYDEYNGGQGKAIKVEVGEFNAENKSFAVRLSEECANYADKIRILTGRRDNAGNLIPVKLFTGLDADYDIFPSGTMLYIMAVKDSISGDATDILDVEFVATSTVGRLGREVYKSVKFNLKVGVSEITLENHTYNNMLSVPIKEVVNGSTLVGSTKIVLLTKDNEYTYSIQTNSTSDGYVVQKEVTYTDSVVEGNARRYTFDLYGVKEGVYTLTFYAQNGISIDVKIRVLTKVDELTITTNSVEQNSDIGKIEYKYTSSNLPTLEGGELILKLGGSANLNINAYLQTYLRRVNYQSVTYEFEDASIVRIDSTNRIYGYNKGTTKVTANVVVFDDVEANGIKTYSMEFNVVVYVALQSATLNTKNITLYTKSTLGDYVDEDGVSDQQKYGTYTFVLKINPEQTEIDTENINVVWTGSEQSLLEKVVNYDQIRNIYSVTVSINSLPIIKETGNAKLTITVSQYGRIIVQEASILIKNAKKVGKIYDVKKVQDKVATNLILKSNSPSLYRDNPSYDYDYYLYFDARDIYEGGLHFTLDEKIDPEDALNPKLIYQYRQIGDFDNILNITDENLIALENGGLGYIDICAVDSYSASENKYTTKVTVLLKIADGLTKSTSLEVASVGDLLKINTRNGLDKFYLQTKNLNLSSQSNWTPIGYIDGEMLEFNGNYDGLTSSDLDEETNATISGLRLISYANDTKTHYGLFAKLGEDSVVENLNIDVLAVNITSNAQKLYVGAVAGECFGELRNIKTNFINGGYDVLQNVNITARDVAFGGIVGQNGDEQHTNANIANVYSSGKINISATESNIGGLVGLNYAKIDGATTFFNQSQFNYSYNSDMYIVATNQDNVGGVVGTTYAEVKNASFAGTLVARNNVGGIAGQTFANMQNVYSCGNIVAQNNVGGLVGYAKGYTSQLVELKNSSVNMFSEDVLGTSIIANSNAGGLVGYAENVNLQNVYARSYIKPDKDGFDGDIKVETENAYVGGLVGYAKDLQVQKAYSILKINAENANVGGLVGYAEDVLVQIAFERNTANLTGLAVAEENGTNTLNFFYSSNDGDYGVANTQNVKKQVPQQTQLSDWEGWNITTQPSLLGTNDWYIRVNETYPFIIFNDNEILTVESPTSIDVAMKDGNSNSYAKYIKQVKDDSNNVLPDTYVLYKGKNTVIKFRNLFEVSVLPLDDLLNIGAEYSLSSSNSNIIQITGRTSMDYKLKLNSTGKVVLRLTSRFSSDVTKEITIYVLNAVRDFQIKPYTNQNLLVGTQYELVSSVNNGYVNNNDYYIKYDNNTNGKILINGGENATAWHKNNEKMFITATKSGPFSIKYSLYVRLVIGNITYNVPLINDNLDGIEEIQNKQLSFNFIYGIKDFLCDTTTLETGLNDYANIKYTLTGDDLRIAKSSNVYELPKFEINFSKNSDYWRLKLVYVNVYIGNKCYVITNSTLVQDENNSNRFVCQYNLNNTDELYIKLQNNNNEAGVDNRVFKVEYLFEVKINSAKVQTQFKINSDMEKFTADMAARVSIIESGIVDFSTNTAEKVVDLSIKRQKLDNISLNFYTNAEKIKNSDNEDVYTINEVPSNAIIAGQTGMLKIALAPVNAEIKSVKITYNSPDGYNMSINQVLKHTTQDELDSSKEIVEYVTRKPYAVAINNGMGLELYYTESNWHQGESGNSDYTSYDGFLYVNCIISSSVPTNSVFYITVDVIYINDYHLSSTIDLISRLPSTMSISYNFYSNANRQVLQDKVYLPINVEKEFYVDFVEIVDQENILSIESMLEPSKIFGKTNIEFARNADNSIKMTSIGSGYRVYYVIKSETKTEEFVQATVTKVKNGIQTTFQSNSIEFDFVDFVITGIEINDGGNDTNILTVPQSTTKKLDVKLIYDVAEKIVDGQNVYPLENKINGGAGDKTIAEYISELTASINKNYNYWFSRKTNISQNEDLYKYYPLAYKDAGVTKINNFENYYAYIIYQNNNIDYISVGVKHINTTAVIYNEIAIEYNENGYPVLANEVQSEYIGSHKLGLMEISNKYYQYLQDDVTLNLISDVSSKKPIPVNNKEEFLQMTNGKDGEIIYYALTNDIELDDYIPMNIDNISIDGNMHTITINSFQTKTLGEDGVAETYISNYGLFNQVGANAIVQNLTVNYNGLSKISDGVYNVELITKSDNNDVDFGLSSFSFGGICAQNNGIIYNVKVKGAKLKFTNNSSNQNYIAGVCANNAGYISYTTSELQFEANCGFVAGFVAVNSKKISNSKVVLNGSVTNTFTSDTNSLTGGFAARNSGDIFGCYVSASSVINQLIYSGKIESRSTVGGFVNENTGNISNCYSNVEIVSTTRAAGFVFDNSGSVESSYSSCSLLQNSNAHTPFVGTSELSTSSLNSGTIEDCYYIASSEEFTSITEKQAVAAKVETDAGANSKKSSYAKFVFADKDKLNGNWTYNYDGNTAVGNPQLVDANLTIYSKQISNGLEMGADGTAYYSWTFDPSSPGHGKVKDGKYNPRTLKNIDEWDNVLGQKASIVQDLNKDIFVVLKDITASRDETPATSSISFGGKLLGNNMKISGLYLRVSKDKTVSKSFGLFKEIVSLDNDVEVVVKDLNLVAKQVMASYARNVGTLAGFIKNASIININIDCSDVEAIQGRNMVGALAGIINNSTITKIIATGSVNAGYIERTYEFANYNEDYNDLDILTNDKNPNDAPYSYAGTLAGALIGNTTAKYIEISGDNKVIGYYAGSVVGLVDKDAQLILAHTQLDAQQYVRAYAVSGGVVGENRGIIDRTYIEHQKSVQDLIDSDTSSSSSYKSGRNLTFFKGSPYFIGGFVGFNNGGTITNSYSKLDVRITTYVTLASGGFVGLDVGGNIQNCYATGSVIGIYNIGGFIGAVSNEQTLLGSTIGLSSTQKPLDTSSRNNIDGTNDKNMSAAIFLSNYQYNPKLREGTDDYYWKQEKLDTRTAYISTSKLFLNNNIASNRWLFGNTDNLGLKDEDYIENSTFGLFIGSVIDNQAKNTENLIANKEEYTPEETAMYGYKDTDLTSVFDDKLLEDNYTFADDAMFGNYINTQAYPQTGRNAPILNQQTITRENNGSILKSILSYYGLDDDPVVVYVDGVNDIKMSSTIGNIKTGILLAIQHRSIGGYKDTFLFTGKMSTLPTDLCKCEANETLITFDNIIKRDELLVDLTKGLYKDFTKYIKLMAAGVEQRVYDYQAFTLPEYSSATPNTSPIYPTINININNQTINVVADN